MNGFNAATTPEIVSEKLEKLLQKLSLPKPITVDDIKDIIWNAQKPSGSSQLFSLLAPHAKNQEIVEEIMQVMQDAWNYFPHRVLISRRACKRISGNR